MTLEATGCMVVSFSTVSCSNVEVPLIIACPESRRDDECARQHVSNLEQHLSACGRSGR